MDSKQIDVMVADASHEQFWIPSGKLPKCGAQALPNVRTNMSQPK